MQCSKSCVIPGCKLIKCKTVNIDFKCEKSEYIFVTGIVLSPIGVPLAFSAVEVTRIDNTVVPRKKEYVGVSFTDKYGNYGFTIPRSDKYSYCLKAYCYVQ